MARPSEQLKRRTALLKNRLPFYVFRSLLVGRKEVNVATPHASIARLPIIYVHQSHVRAKKVEARGRGHPERGGVRTRPTLSKMHGFEV